MSAEEKRELDDYCAEKVMDWWRGIDADGNVVWYGKNRFMLKRSEWEPTVDDADAMAVLRKCAEKCTVTVECGINVNNDWQAMVARLNQEGKKTVEDFCTCAPTLPLAICLFAKKLYGG